MGPHLHKISSQQRASSDLANATLTLLEIKRSHLELAMTALAGKCPFREPACQSLPCWECEHTQATVETSKS